MSNITRFDPFKDVADFAPLWDRNDLFRGFSLRPFFRDMELEPQIKLDVSESDTAYQVKADIPGVNKDDIKVSVDGNQVSISAEVKKEKEEKKDEKIIRSERYFGKVSRSFTLSSDVDADKVQAKYTGGVLELSMPKKGNGRSKEIKIS